MGLPKGRTNNPKGKPKGSKAKKTIQWESIGEYLINDGSKKYKEYLEKLDEKEFASEFRAILEYFKPKQTRTETETSGNIRIIIDDPEEPNE